MNLRHALTNNMGVKIIALVVSIFIWFNASGQQQMVRLRTIPLVIENIPDTLIITGTIPRNAEVRVTGTRRKLLVMGFQRLHAAIDLTGARPGLQRFPLTSNNVRIPSGIDRRNVAVISPSGVDLNLERLVTKRVQAALTTTGELPDDLVLLDGGLSMSPTWITIRGPASTIDRIRAIPTKPFDLQDIKDASGTEVELEFDASLIDCEPDRVVITTRVSVKGERVLANVPPTILVDTDDVDAVVLPNTVSLTVEGTAAMLDTLSSGDVTVLLNLSGRRPGQYTMAPEVMLPPGVTLVGMSVDSLIIRLTRTKSQR